MGDDCTFDWQLIDSLPLFSATIQVMLEETEQQHYYILFLKDEAYTIEKYLFKRITIFYQIQLNKVMYYEEQLQRWLLNSDFYNEKILNTISKLKTKVEAIKTTSHSIIKIAAELQINRQHDQRTSVIDKKILFDFIEGKFKEKN